MSKPDITRDGLPDRLRALAEDEIAGRSTILSPANSHDLLAAADEIDRLRITDAEREALCFAAATCRGVGRAVRAWPENQWADIIDALLKRHENGGEG